MTHPLAQAIDHTLLKPESTRDDLVRLCAEAREHGFYSVCVNSSNVALAAELLANSPVKVCAVVGFPLGASSAAAKAFETRDAIACGAGEIDMVLHVGALRSKDYTSVLEDIAQVVQAAQGVPVKVILETGALTHEEKIIACALAKAARAAFVKTSTGFGPGGATVEDIRLMRQLVGPEMGVKASGGIRDRATALAMLEAGATRLGCSASVAIVQGEPSGGQGY